MQQPIVLSVGQDPMLLGTRNLVLQAAGFTVISASSLHEVLREIQARDFDVLIVCHSTPDEDRKQITSASRAKDPKVPIVLVSDRTRVSDSAFDAVVEAAPEHMLKTVKDLLRAASQGPGSGTREQPVQ